MQRPASKYSGPEATFDVHNGPVRVTSARRQARKDPLVRQRAVARAIEGVDDAGQRVGVIEDLAVGTFRRPIADHVPRVARYAAFFAELVQRTARVFLVVVHGPEP